MKQARIVEQEICTHQPNELIFASKLYSEKLADQVSEPVFYKTLERMCKAGVLAKAAKGTYYIPKKGAFGMVPLSEKDIVSAFTSYDSGTVIGYSLYNKLGLTTQIAKQTEVLSCALDGQTKQIRNVLIHQAPLHFSEKTAEMVHVLEVLQNVTAIQDINYHALLSYSRSIAEQFDEAVFKEVISKRKYAKSTIAFLREILEHYGKKNQLNRYLSSMSTYKYPNMEELYEAAHLS